MEIRFKPNDTVMYGSHGACTMVEIAEKEFAGEKKDYYVLRPLHSGNSLYYVPLDSEMLTARMHAPLCAEELRRAIAGAVMAEWIEEDRQRQNWFKQVLDGGNTHQLLCAHKALIARQKELSAIGKKMRAVDDRYLREIENLLFEEISLAFTVTKEELADFLLGADNLAEKV